MTDYTSETLRAHGDINRDADGLVGRCAVCRQLPVLFDCSYTDEFWAALDWPTETRISVVCFDCVCQKAARTGLDVVSNLRFVYATGPGGTVGFVPAGPVLAHADAMEKLERRIEALEGRLSLCPSLDVAFMDYQEWRERTRQLLSGSGGIT